MGLIREPEGVDFVIQSKPLTDEEQKALSNFILEYKKKHSKDKPALKHRIEKKKSKVAKTTV